ncbi:hypothetical protein DT076_16650 [Desertihabitans brevis]|uniref:Phage portal protein n=1 Tax=Desertihabitans brevis TaxID=2268447 RepID=A0A367YQV8_9ACTN|nr:hypothetical protein [Desertihabitans brevis]RCK68276.1 hypothetical protein DT076_16650 [Desertihabitans brevis]
MPDWTLTENGYAPAGTVPARDSVEALETAWRLEQLSEALADAQALLAKDDAGWARLGDVTAEETPEARKARVGRARLMAGANALIKRGLGLRIGYIWGQGVELSIRQDEDSPVDVNAVLQTFLDDPSNRATFTGADARERLEHTLGTDGELGLACDTDPVTGRVQVRRVPAEQITDRITDPEDAATVRFYRREFTVQPLNVDGTKGTAQTRVVWHPALGYTPPVGQRQPQIGCKPVRWDQPIRWVSVNRVGESWRGVGDVEAALPWAKASKEFLEQWALLMRALTRIAWRATSKGDKTQQTARQMQTAVSQDVVGGTAVMSPGQTLEAVPKTGATIDADSGRPLQMMVASALGVPVTMLLGDPGATGARAVAETLDQPTELEMGRRRRLWAEVMRDIVDHVIDAAVIGLRGPLRGTVVQQGDRRLVTLPEGASRTLVVAWPSWDSTSVDVLMKAIAAADGTDTVPPLVLLRLILQAFGVDDIDEIIKTVTDDQGRFVPPADVVAQARADADQDGQGL